MYTEFTNRKVFEGLMLAAASRRRGRQKVSIHKCQFRVCTLWSAHLKCNYVTTLHEGCPSSKGPPNDTLVMLSLMPLEVGRSDLYLASYCDCGDVRDYFYLIQSLAKVFTYEVHESCDSLLLIEGH